jgi:hypothetical protein
VLEPLAFIELYFCSFVGREWVERSRLAVERGSIHLASCSSATTVSKEKEDEYLEGRRYDIVHMSDLR